MNINIDFPEWGLRLKLLFWLSINGCGIQGLDCMPTFYFRVVYPLPSLTELISIKKILELFSRISLVGDFFSAYPYELRDKYRRKDWKGAKQYGTMQYEVMRHPWQTTYTNEYLDDIPF